MKSCGNALLSVYLEISWQNTALLNVKKLPQFQSPPFPGGGPRSQRNPSRPQANAPGRSHCIGNTTDELSCTYWGAPCPHGRVEGHVGQVCHTRKYTNHTQSMGYSLQRKILGRAFCKSMALCVCVCVCVCECVCVFHQISLEMKSFSIKSALFSQEFNPVKHFIQDGQVVKPNYFQPFGVGKRTCLGETLAKNDTFLICATLLQKLKFKPVPGERYFNHDCLIRIL